MVRGLVILGALAGAGWYAYRKVVGGGIGSTTAQGTAGTGDRSSTAGGITGRVTQSVSQAATAARQAATTAATKVRTAVPVGGGAAADQTEQDGSPREARAAALAAMPAVQPPATIPEP